MLFKKTLAQKVAAQLSQAEDELLEHELGLEYYQLKVEQEIAAINVLRRRVDRLNERYRQTVRD